MTILGIDPGFGIVGYGVVDFDGYNLVAVDYGVIETSKNLTLAQRLEIIEKAMNQILETYNIDCVSMEELFYMHNQTTVIPVAEARGVLLLSAYKHCKNLFEYTPMQIKQALTGNGRADKKQMQFMVKNILGLSQIPKPDDAADALAAAICHSQINPNLNTNQIT